MLGNRQELNHSRIEEKQSFNSEIVVPSTVRSYTGNTIPTHLSQVSSTRITPLNMPTGRKKVTRPQHYSELSASDEIWEWERQIFLREEHTNCLFNAKWPALEI